MFDGYGLLGLGVFGKVASATVIGVVFENVVAADAGATNTTKIANRAPTTAPASHERPRGRDIK
jgi:hypothetical protein